MRIWKQAVLFYLGGTLYMIMEFGFRGWSHGSMCLAGGICFLLLGGLQRVKPRLPLVPRLLAGSLIITMVELGMGLVVNRNYQVWDYRNQPLNFCGQVCLRFSLLWIPVGLVAMVLYDLAETALVQHPAMRVKN